MEKARVATLALVLALGGTLAAQEPHFGLGIGLSIPTGKFNSTSYSYPDGTTSTEGYDTTLGGQFTVSFPVDQRLALRLDVYGQSTTGTDTAPALPTYNLQHDLFSLGGEAQYFPGNGDAYRHRGGYLLGGLSMDLERFRSRFFDLDYDVNKTRLGGLVGAGYSFRPFGRWRTNAELAFHKTLSAYDTNAQPTVGNPAAPPADFVRLTYGVVF
jgi:hypothetical protein